MTFETPKLIALDIDGTLMNKSYLISDRVKDAVSKAIAKGVHVMLATGRMYSATVPIGQELNLITPLIVYQGSLVKEFHNSEKVLLHHQIDKQLSCKLIEDLRKEDIQVNVYYDDKLYVEADAPILHEYATRRNIPFYKLKSFTEIQNFLPTKILAMDPDPVKIDKLKHKYNEKYSDVLNITKSTDYFCEFVDVKCSKADAILFLAEQWGIPQSQIMAIGDQDNDKEMLKAAGLGVAMGNGHQELKDVADHVTDTVDNDGVAVAIERFVL